MSRKLIIIAAFFISIMGYSQNHEQIRLLTEKGDKYYQQNNIEKAEKTFKKIIKLDSLHKDTYFNLGAIALQKNNANEAIGYFKKCVELGDLGAIDILETNLNYDFSKLNIDKVEHSEVLYKIGLKLLSKNDKEKAELYFLKSNKYNKINSSDKQFTLEGRLPLNRPLPKFICSKQGKVVVSIIVDRKGKVTEATAGVKGSTTTANCLLKEAKNAALQTKWQPKPNAPENQRGQITYNFKLR
ncbi:MAG: hypothetical protein COA88_07330 [Kordia sp.]|nr:MAG: hypothetical protein COA88_07330 [Kordia sp.]